MNEIDKIATALVALQGDLKPVGKTADNPFFKSKYAPLPEVRAAIQPLLAKHGLALVTFPAIFDGKNGLRFYLFHESGQHLTGEWLLTPVKHDPQGEGSDTTYKSRYAIMAITGLVADEDDDANTASSKRESAALKGAKDRLRNAIKSSGVDGSEYSWVATSTDADIDRIEGLAEALSMGTAKAES